MRLYLVMSIPNGWGGVKLTTLSMKIYLAEHDANHWSWPKTSEKGNMRLRILLSYWYYKNTNLDELFQKYFDKPYPDVFADSGAFSAMTQDSEVSIEEYMSWLYKWKHLFTSYSNLDVIMNAPQTLKNQTVMESNGLKPLPVFHINERFDYLQKYIEQYQYIALGVAGMQTKRKSLFRWLIKCFQMAEGKSVYHGFGLTGWEIMSSFPWYSVDSSSWGSGFRYGRVPIFDKKKGKFINLGLGDEQAWRKHGKLIKGMGFEPKDFANRERNDRAKICAISALSYMLAEKWLRNYHGEVSIPKLADANPKRFNEAANGLKLHLSDTSNGLNYRDAFNGLKIYLGEANATAQDIRRAKGIINEKNST